jgi:molecular chaperone Hsp33
MQGDFISRIICDELNIRAYTVVTSASASEITRVQQCNPISALILGRMINAAALLGATLKPGSNQTITLRMSVTGPLKELHVQADARGDIRGYAANPNVEFDPGSSDMKKYIGSGFLNVIKDLGMKEPVTSVLAIMHADIAKDVARYLSVSEQIPSALILSTEPGPEGNIINSAGILIQTFPGTKEETIGIIEKNILSSGSSLGKFLSRGNDINAYLSNILGGAPFTVLETTPLRAKCGREMLLEALRGFESEEIQDMIEKDGGAELSCMFCRNVYRFSADDLAGILKDRNIKHSH